MVTQAEALELASELQGGAIASEPGRGDARRLEEISRRLTEQAPTDTVVAAIHECKRHALAWAIPMFNTAAAKEEKRSRLVEAGRSLDQTILQEWPVTEG